MDSNQLLHYLRGFFELVAEPTPEQIRAIRTEVLSAKPVEAQIIPIEMRNPISQAGCGCGGGTPPPPYIDREKIPL